MKTTLLFLCGLSALGMKAQSPIQEFYGHLPIAIEYPYDGYSHRSYDILQSGTPIDQSAAGANVSWTFNGLTPVGLSEYIDSVPTAGELSTYPGTARVLTTTNNVDSAVTTAYFSDASAFVGLSAGNGLELHYDDSGVIGAFPLSYGYSNTDAVAGTYTYTTYSGTFTGDIVSSVDAYGTLNFTVGSATSTYDVTRLKVVQTLNLTYFPFGTVGSVVITNYYYYYNTIDPIQVHFPTFTSTETVASIPLLSVNQDVITLEAGIPAFLGTPAFNLENQLAIAPNPVGNVLSVHANDNINIRSIKITDANGRTVATASDLHAVDVSHLSKGIYFAKIESDHGNMTKKFIKD